MPHGKQHPKIDVTRYRGQWLALHPTTHKVIAHNRSPKAARENAIKLGVNNPILYAVRKSDAYFVGVC